jgi:hypothetical protein
MTLIEFLSNYLDSITDTIDLYDFAEYITTDSTNENYILFDLVLNKIRASPDIKYIYLYGLIKSEGIILLHNILLYKTLIDTPSPLELLSFVGCNIGTLGVTWIGEILKLKNICIKNLIINNDTLNTDGCTILGNILAENTTLEELNLSSAIQVDISMYNIILGLSYNTNIVTLILSNNYIYNSFYPLINTFLQNNKKITNLYLSNVAFDEPNFGFHKMWIDVLSINNSIKIIDISSNNLNDTDIDNIYNAMKTNTTIERIYMENNIFITDDGINKIFELLENHSSLKVLKANFI